MEEIHALFERPHAHVSDRKHLRHTLLNKNVSKTPFSRRTKRRDKKSLRELHFKKSRYHDGIVDTRGNYIDGMDIIRLVKNQEMCF